MNLFSFSTTPNPTAAQKDLPWLDAEVFQILVVGFIILGSLVALFAAPLAGFFTAGLGDGKEAPVLGILLVTAAILAYIISLHRLSAGVIVLIGCLAGCILLGLAWGAGPGALYLLLLPFFLALLLTNIFVSLLVGTTTILLLFNIPFLAWGHSASERFVLAFLIMALWLLFVLVERRLAQMIYSFRNGYLLAMHEREEARDERLRVRQLNDDLAQAYVQLRRLNDLLQGSTLEAEAARRAKEEFVARVSHELRTPINMVIGFSEMIISSPETYGADLPLALLSDIGVIHRNSRHLSQLINDVLVLSQANAGQMSLTRSWVPIGEIISEAVHAIQPLFRMKGLTLEICLPDAALPVYCDKLRIRQVLLNLLSNAGRHTASGGATIRVELSERAITVAVQDTGPGIAPEDQKRIFDPFQQLDEPGSEQNMGSGLGLTISQQLVQLHGGKMWLESQPGSGATFFFSLSISPSDLSNFRVVQPGNPYSTYMAGERRPLPALPAPKQRLLVLERENNLGNHLAALLPATEVTMVNEVRKLSEETRRHPPAAVIINDAGAMNDAGFSRHLLNLPERTPIFSCYVPGHNEAITQLNIADYLVKPVTRSQLLQVVANVTKPGSSILCVEDNSQMARLVRRQLNSVQLGYRILEANNGATAIEMIRTRRPDMILLDLGLPDQDGYEILRQKNTDPLLRQIPVVVVTARDPQGGPVVTGRLRVELVGGLSLRDIAECTNALTNALAPGRKSAHSAPAERLLA